MDITETLAPKSDQLDAVDLLGGPRTFTITGVKAGNEEQPVQISLAEFPVCGDLASPCAVFWLRRGALTPRRGSDAASPCTATTP